MVAPEPRTQATARAGTGLLPLALGKTGLGGWAYYYPLARTVMGGLVSSTLHTLIVLPYINDGIEGLSLWACRAWRASAPRPEAPSTPAEQAVPTSA